MIDFEYILLKDKIPVHKFKTSATTKTYDQVKDRDSYGVIIPEGFVVLDFDTTSDADIILEIMKNSDLKVRVMKTTRGYHVWFKNPLVEVKPDVFKPKISTNFIKRRLAIGITADSRAGGKRGYVKWKSEGVMREWVIDTPFDELDDVPNWLLPVSAPADKYMFKGMSDGDGRNGELFSYILYLQGKGFKRDDIIDTLDIINDYVFDDPIPDYEMEQLTRDESFRDDDEIAEQRERRKMDNIERIEESKANKKKDGSEPSPKEKKVKKKDSFSHNKFGDVLISEYNIHTMNGKMFVYEDGYYQEDERIIEQKMIDLYPAIKQKKRSEVLSYIKIMTHYPAQNLKVNPYIINLKNTRLDVKTGKQLPFDPKFLEFDRIPVEYDPNAYNADLDNMLKRVFCNDQEVIDLFDEMVGYLLIKHGRYRAGFMLTGTGQNGKSTILNLLKAFLGANNYTTIELDKLTDRFSTAELEHKLANIGDDINSTSLKNTGTLKKLFTGESLQVERKGERPFTLRPYAKMIFSMNDIPQSYDRSDGFYSRLMFIPFNAKFSVHDDDFDPNIADKIMTDEAMSYLLNRALVGATRLMSTGGFTVPAVVKEASEAYKRDNSIVLQWIDDEGITEDRIMEISSDDLFKEYEDWCVNSGIKTNERVGKIKFNKEIEHTYKMVRIQKRVGDKRVRFFSYDLEV